MLDSEKMTSLRKELSMITGAMKHFSKMTLGEFTDLNKALSTTYRNKYRDAEKIKNGEANLNELANEHHLKIKSPNPPRDGSQQTAFSHYSIGKGTSTFWRTIAKVIAKTKDYRSGTGRSSELEQRLKID